MLQVTGQPLRVKSGPVSPQGETGESGLEGSGGYVTPAPSLPYLQPRKVPHSRDPAISTTRNVSPPFQEWRPDLQKQVTFQ